jgi:hypothetical protein
MGARIAMKRLAKMNLTVVSARRLDFTIGLASGERQVPATCAGYDPETGFCQLHGRVVISAGDGRDQTNVLGAGCRSAYGLMQTPQDGSRPAPG